MKEILLANELINVMSSSNSRKERYAGEIEWINLWKNLWVSDRIRVGVIGVTSSGKSTLINAMLGDDLLSVVVRPSSSQLVSCSYSKERNATVYFLNKDKKVLKNDSKLKDAVIQYSDEGYNKKNQKQVAQVELSTPRFSLGEDVLLVDSPGLDATGYEIHEKLTLETLLPTVDVVIFVTTVKSEVDKKMKQTLDTIAKYHCPVMIVQNMLDAVRPSVDGKKSASDVAKERLNRVRLAVEQSKIENKAEVKIAQISAIYAMEYRCQINKDKNSEKKYKQSRYDSFVDDVKELLEYKRPAIEEQRIQTILTRVEELIRQEEIRNQNIPAENDDISVLNNTVSEIQCEYNKTYRSIEKVLRDLDDMYHKYLVNEQPDDESENKILKVLKDALLRNSHKELDENEINEMKEMVRQFEKTVVEGVQSFTKVCADNITKLNLPMRDMWSYNGLPRMPEAEVKTKIVERSKTVRKEGGGQTFLRIITLGIYKGEEVVHYTETVIDKEATQESVKRYIERLVFEYEKTLETWSNKANSTIETIQQEVELRIASFKEKEQQILDANDWKKMKKELEKCIEKYRNQGLKQSKNNKLKQRPKKEVEEAKFIKSKKEVIRIYVASQRYLYGLQKSSINYAIRVKNRENKPTLVVSNSPDNLSEFLQRFYGVEKKDFVKEKWYQITKEIQVACAPTVEQLDDFGKQSKECNVLLLINGLQFHTEYETTLRERVQNAMILSSALFLVIQDFDVLANGNAIAESIRAIRIEQINSQVGKSGLALISHNNPLYNMALIYAQINEGKIKEETVFYDELMKNFPSLVDENVKKRINSIMRTKL